MLKIFQNDCFEILPTITHKIDLVLVDLPYGVINTEYDKRIDLEKLWKQLKNITKDKAIFLFFGNLSLGMELIKSNPQWYRYELIWNKHLGSDFFNAKKQPLKSHEYVFVFYKNRGTYNPQMRQGFDPYRRVISTKQNNIYNHNKIDKHVSQSNGERYPLTVIDMKKSRKQNKTKQLKHPFAKPIPLLELLIKQYSEPNDLVIDFTMGSGSTAIACMNTGRGFIGIERDANFFRLARDQIVDYHMNSIGS